MSSENAIGLSKGAWVSLIVFAVLLVLVAVTRETRVEVGIKKLELTTLDKAEVKRIEVSGKHKALLTKDGAGWTVSDPTSPDKKLAAEKSSVDAALDALAELEAGAFVTGRQEKHADLEIDDDKGVRVKIESEKGPSLDVIFGRGAKGGGNYLRLAGSDEVYVGKGRFASLVKKDVNAWRKRKLLDVEADALSRVVVEPAGKAAYTLEATLEGEGDAKKKTWRFVDGIELPEGFRVDATALGRIASSLAGLRATDFAEGVSDADTGLAEGSKLTATSKDGKSWTIRFGKEDDKKRVYARVEGDEQLYLISSYSVTSMLKDKLDLRDLTLMPFEATKAERALFRSPNGTVEVVKKDGVWTLVQPESTPDGFEFDAGGVEGKLSGLSRVRGASLVDPAPAAGASGLSAPETSIEVTLEGGQSVRLAFGKEAPKLDDKGGQELFALGADGLVYRVAAFQKNRYEKPLDLFKKVEMPPMPPGGGMGGGMGMGGGLDQLPPEVRKQLEQAMRQQGR